MWNRNKKKRRVESDFKQFLLLTTGLHLKNLDIITLIRIRFNLYSQLWFRSTAEHNLEKASLKAKKSLRCRTPCSQIHPASSWYITCETCSYVALSQYQLNRHRSHEHTSAPSGLKCNYCGKAFVKADKLQKHEEGHTNGQLEREFPCPRCGKVFRKDLRPARCNVGKNVAKKYTNLNFFI